MLAAHTHTHTHTHTHSLLWMQLLPAAAEGESNYIKTWQQWVLCLQGGGRALFKCIMKRLAGPLLIKQVFDSGFGLKEDWICLFACGEVSDFEVEIRQISVNWQRPVQTDTPPAYKQSSGALPLRTSQTEQSPCLPFLKQTLGFFGLVHVKKNAK